MALRTPVAMDTAGAPTSPPRPSSGPVTQLINCRLLRDGELVHDDLWIQDGVIIDPRERFFTHKLTSDHKVDLGGLIVSPGYIDSQINGAFGVDFSTCVPDELPAGLRKVAFGLLQHGVTSFLPTLMSSSPENYRRILANVQPTPGTVHNGAEILGWHLEGPFLNANVAGSHDKAYIRSFEPGRNGIHDVYGPFLDSVRIITIAPELQGALDVIQRLSRAGIVVAAGTGPDMGRCGPMVALRGANAQHASWQYCGSLECRTFGGHDNRGRGRGARRRDHGDAPVQRHDPGTHDHWLPRHLAVRIMC